MTGDRRRHPREPADVHFRRMGEPGDGAASAPPAAVPAIEPRIP